VGEVEVRELAGVLGWAALASAPALANVCSLAWTMAMLESGSSFSAST